MRRPSPQLLRVVLPLLLAALFVFEFTTTRKQTGAHTTKPIDLSQLITRVETKPGSIERVVFDPGSLLVTATLTGGNVLKANYPSDQSALLLQDQLERQRIDFAAKAPSHLGPDFDPRLAAAVASDRRGVDLLLAPDA